MAVEYGAGTAVAAATRTDTTYTVSGIAEGDLIVIAHYESAATEGTGGALPTPTAPTGFTAPAGTWPIEVKPGSTYNNFAVWVWEKIAGSDESGSYTVDHTSITSLGVIFYVTGNDSSSPITALSQNSGIGETTTFDSVTTTVADELVVAIGADGYDFSNSLDPPSGSTPTFTKQANTFGIGVNTGTLATAGATGNPTMTNNSTSVDGWIAVMFAVQPPVVAGTAAGSFSFSGTAAGTAELPGAASASFAFEGTAAGTVEQFATATGGYTFTGAAVGSASAPAPPLLTRNVGRSWLYLPFIDAPLVPQWEWWLVDSQTLGQIAQLNVHQRQIVSLLDAPDTITGWVHMLDSAAAAVVPHQTALLLVRNDEVVSSGQIWQANESSQTSGTGQQSGEDTLSITAFGWFNVLGSQGSDQNGRLVHTGAEFLAMLYVNGVDGSDGLMPNYQAWIDQNNGQPYTWQGGIVVDEATTLAYDAVEYPQTTDALIIFDLLDRANIDSPTLIQRGNVYGSPLQRNLTLQRFQNVGQEIIQLVNVEAGVDWVIDPLTREMDLYGVGASSSPLITSGYGVDRGQGCLFSYPGNCVSYQRTRDGTMTQNRVEAVGEYGVGRADAISSQQQNGLLEAQDSLSEVTDPNILAAYANEEVAVRAQPWEIITLTPRALMASDYTGRPGVPRPYDDYVIGDIAYGYVNHGCAQIGTSAQNPQAMRIFGYTLTIDDDGTERVTAVQTNYTSLGTEAS